MIARRTITVLAGPGLRSSRRWFVLAILAGTPLPSTAQTLAGGWHNIRLEQVVAALADAEMPLESAEVRLLAQTTSTSAEPRLEVKGVEPWGDHGARVRLQCEAQQCLPFYVAVNWKDARIAKAAMRAGIQPGSNPVRSVQAREQVGGNKPSVVSDHKPGVAAGVSGNTPADQGPQGTEAIVHPGTRATLLIDGQRLHIKLPVICLEKGSPGSTVRVSALDHKQTYLAEVIDSTLLKGTL